MHDNIQLAISQLYRYSQVLKHQRPFVSQLSQLATYLTLSDLAKSIMMHGADYLLFLADPTMHLEMIIQLYLFCELIATVIILRSILQSDKALFIQLYVILNVHELATTQDQLRITRDINICSQGRIQGGKGASAPFINFLLIICDPA